MCRARESAPAPEIQPALAVAAPPSTQASSKAASASARFLGPMMNPPSSGSMKAAVMPARSKASIISALPGVHSWVLRSPAATSRATVPRATPRADCTSICRSKRSANAIESVAPHRREGSAWISFRVASL